MEKKDSAINAPIILLMVLMYVLVAMSDNFKGVFVPLFKDEFNVTNTAVSYVLTAAMFAYAVFQYLGGILIGKFGYKKVLEIGFCGGIGALLVLVIGKSFIALIIGMFILNAGVAMFNIGVNTLAPIMTVASTVVLMNLINFSYGVSNTAIQKVSGKILEDGVSWRAFYLAMLVCMVVLFLYLLYVKIPYVPQVSPSGESNSNLFHNKMLYLYFAAVGFYLISEFNIANWFTNYMSESFKMAANERAFYVALFFGSETIGRLVGGFVVDKIGRFKSIFLYSSIATVMLFLGISLGQSGLFIFGLAGFFYSIVYPTIFSSVVNVFGQKASYATGLISMVATIAAMASNMLMGVLNDAIGTFNAFYIVAVAMLLSTVFGAAIGKNVKT